MVNTLYSPFKRGGAEVSVQRVIETLSSTFSFTVLTQSEVKQEDNINGIKVVRWPVNNIYSVFNYDLIRPNFLSKLIWQCMDFLNPIVFVKALLFFKKNKFDLIWTNNLSGFSLSIWAAAKWCGIPIVHTARDFYLLSNNVTLFDSDIGNIQAKGIVASIKKRLLNHYVPYLSALVCISQSMGNMHKQVLVKNKDKVKRIYNSVGLVAQETVKKKPNKRRTFGYIGQISNAKGIIDLLKAFSITKMESDFLIAGAVPEELKKQYTDPRIQFLGFLPPGTFYSEIDCLLVPSKWREPFGRVVLEALSYRIPVLCTENGGLKELSTLFKSVECVDFAAPIEQILSKDIKFYEEDLQVISRCFSDEEISSQYASLFSLVINSQHPTIRDTSCT